MLQVSRHDDIAGRVTFEPPLAAPQQLFDLVVSYPIVLVVVQHRDEYVQVSQHVAEATRGSQRNREQPAGAERRHGVVERMPRRLDLVTERLEQSSEKGLTAATWHGGETRPRVATRWPPVPASARSDRTAPS